MTERENGNVLFLILIAVALFAALSYAVTRASRDGGTGIAGEKNDLDVSKTVQYLTDMRNAVMRLKIGGCSETQISFENTRDTAYVNPNAPADKHCHVFHPQGGNLGMQKFGSLGFFISRAAVDGIGTAKTDLMFIGHLVGADFCAQLTRKLYGAALPAPTETVQAVPRFVGDYGDPDGIAIGDGAAFWKEKPVGCFGDTGAGKATHLYFVLMER